MDQGVRQAAPVPGLPPQRDASDKPDARRIVVALVVGKLSGGVQHPRRQPRSDFQSIVGPAAFSKQRFDPGAALIKATVEIPEPAKRARQSPAGFAARIVSHAFPDCRAQVFVFALQAVQPGPPLRARQVRRGLVGQMAEPIPMSLAHGGRFAAFGQTVPPVLPNGFQTPVSSLPALVFFVDDEIFSTRNESRSST